MAHGQHDGRRSGNARQEIPLHGSEYALVRRVHAERSGGNGRHFHIGRGRESLGQFRPQRQIEGHRDLARALLLSHDIADLELSPIDD